MEAVDEILRRVLEELNARTGMRVREISDAILADGMCNPSNGEKDGRAPEDARPQSVRERHGEDRRTFTLPDAQEAPPVRLDGYRGGLSRRLSDKCSVTDAAADRATQVTREEEPPASG